MDRIAGIDLQKRLSLRMCFSAQMNTHIVLFPGLIMLNGNTREHNVCALHYAAHDIRQAIEQLLFEEIFFCAETKLRPEDYKNCKGNSTKFYKIIRKLNPHYEKLVEFMQGVLSTDSNSPPTVMWDTNKLMKYSGKVSNYLHWAGEPSETVWNVDWFNKGIEDVEAAARYIWETNLSGYTGIMMPDKMQPEIRDADAWEKYFRGEIDMDSVRTRVKNESTEIL